MIEQRMLTLLTDPSLAYPLLATGNRVLICTEDPLPVEVETHPNTVKLSVLLPPYEVVSMEINGDYNGMSAAYKQYLQTNPTVASIILITALSAYLGTPMALCFGSEVRDLKFGNVLLGYLNSQFGLVFSPYGNGCINTDCIPYVISALYCMGEINGMQALSYYPSGVNIEGNMLNRLIQEMQPPVKMEEANNYFMGIVNQIKGQWTNQYGKEYYSPFTAIPEEGQAK